MQELETALIQQIESKSCQAETKKASSGKGYDDWQRRFEKKSSQMRNRRQISPLIRSEINKVNYFLSPPPKSSENLRKAMVF